MTSEKFREDLKSKIEMNRSLGRNGANWENAAMANCILQEDLGHYPDSPLFDYGLDDEARDRLLAHARQDAAHALCNTETLLKQAKSLRRWLLLTGALVLVQAIVMLNR
jgi:hypothetical protein